MSINFKRFYVLRYSLVKNEQDSLLPNPLPKVKGKTIEIALKDGDSEWMDKNVRFSLVGFHNISPQHNLDNYDFYFGKLARLNHVKIGEKVPRDIVEHKQEDWNSINVIFEMKTQLIFIQKKAKFDNGNVSYICRKLENGLNQVILPYYNYKLFIEPINVKGTFWTEVKRHTKIYELDLKLISPNILETNRKARESLEILQSLYSQEETEIKLKNSQGNLDIPKTPTDNYIDYIEEGEGEWVLEVEENGKKKKISNMNLVDTIELPVNESMSSDIDTDSVLQYGLELGNNSKTTDRATESIIDKIRAYIHKRRRA